MKIKIKITISREPNKLSLFIRQTFKSYRSYIKINILNKINNGLKKIKGKFKMTETKLEAFMKEKDISEDYIMRVLTAMEKVDPEEEEEVEEEEVEDVDETTTDKPDDKDKDKEKEKDVPLTLSDEIKKVIETTVVATIESALKVTRKAPPKAGDHTKKPPKYGDRPEVYI